MTAFLFLTKLLSFLTSTTNLWAKQPRRATKSFETGSRFCFHGPYRDCFEGPQDNVLHGANKKWAAL